MCTWVVNQDRDVIYKLDSMVYLYTLPVIVENKLLGFNVMLNNTMLGTFDGLEESLLEIEYLLNTSEEVYLVSGYCL